jgi:hypothetical protein
MAFPAAATSTVAPRRKHWAGRKCHKRTGKGYNHSKNPKARHAVHSLSAGRHSGLTKDPISQSA